MIIIYLFASAGKDGRSNDFFFFPFFLRMRVHLFHSFHMCASFPHFTAVVKNPRACVKNEKKKNKKYKMYNPVKIVFLVFLVLNRGLADAD